MSDEDFCNLCDVSLDLHDGPDTCTSAIEKAEMIEAFWGAPLGEQ